MYEFKKVYGIKLKLKDEILIERNHLLNKYLFLIINDERCETIYHNKIIIIIIMKKNFHEKDFSRERF